MTGQPAGLERTKFEEFGLSAYTYRYAVETGSLDDRRWSFAHTHLELEIQFVETGAITLECGGREERIGRGEFLAFWGGMPHRDVDLAAPETVYHVAQVPVVNVLIWADSWRVLDRLLRGEMLKSTSLDADPESDRVAFARWRSDLKAGDQRLRRAAEMEVEARLLRLLSQATPVRTHAAPHAGGATAEMVAHAIGYVTRHFMEQISIDDIARAVDRNHDHLMASFRHVCGLTLWEYVTRLRLSEAQRLLAATGLPILAVCHRAGFTSTSRMYDAFDRYCGCTPARYRQRLSG